MEEIKLELNPSGANEDNSNSKADLVKEADNMSKEEAALEISKLTPEEQKYIKDFVEKIDISDSSLVLSYGSGAQNKIAGFSDSVLKNVRTKDMDTVGDLLSELVVHINNFGDEDEKKGFFGLFSGMKKSIDRKLANFNTVEANINKIVNGLEDHRRQLLKDIEMYDIMFENNYNYFKELNMYIIAGKEKLRLVNEVEIPALRAKAEASGDEIDAHRLNDMVNFEHRFSQKIHDLMLSRTISIQMAPQIRLMQNNDALLVDKIQSSITNAIPLWKNQMVIALGLSNAQKALKTQQQVTQTTNELLRRNSEMLKQGSLEIAKESEESIVSIETVKKTNQDLIDTINGILEIQENGKQQRKVAEKELENIENELKRTLLNTKGK